MRISPYLSASPSANLVLANQLSSHSLCPENQAEGTSCLAQICFCLRPFQRFTRQSAWVDVRGAASGTQHSGVTGASWRSSSRGSQHRLSPIVEEPSVIEGMTVSEDEPSVSSYSGSFRAPT